MRATKIEQLLNVEGYVEPGLARMLSLETGINAYPSMSDDVMVSPRIEVDLALGAVTGHRKPYIIDNQQASINDAWDYSLSIRVITRRGTKLKSGGTKELHATTRAKIRLAMLYYRQRLTEEFLPYHQLGTVEESGTSSVVDAGEDVDVSEISFSGTLGIRANAWPES
jgi:hypothetical protein